MKHLFLIRHAKSSWSDSELSDRQRPLSKRGRQQVQAMAMPLWRRNALAGRIYVSDAMRATETMAGLLDNLPDTTLASRIHYDSELYTFSKSALLHFLKRVDGDSVAILGHNPALLELAGELLPEPLERLPTAGCVHLMLPVSRWAQIGKKPAHLESCLLPEQVSYRLFRRTVPDEPRAGNRTLAERIPEALRYQYQLIRRLEPGVVAGEDPEFLHQYRINLRRSRALMESVQRILRVKHLDKALERLKRHAQATSELRDLDVFLQTLDQWARQPEFAAPSDAPSVRAYFQNRQREAHARLRAQLTDRPYQRDMAKWGEFLASGKPGRIAASLTHKQIHKALDMQLRRHSELYFALSEAAPEAQFHRARKSLKRIRYFTELDEVALGKCVKHLKKSQQLFGTFQDRHVQIKLLNDYLNAAAGPSCREGVIGLIAGLEAEKHSLKAAILALGVSYH